MCKYGLLIMIKLEINIPDVKVETDALQFCVSLLVGLAIFIICVKFICFYFASCAVEFLFLRNSY